KHMVWSLSRMLGRHESKESRQRSQPGCLRRSAETGSRSRSDLPFGRGKKYESNVNGVADKLVSGWGIDTIVTFQRGFPIIIGGCPGPLSNSGIPNTGCARPVRTALSHLTTGSLNQRLTTWFDTSVFTKGTDFSYGTDSRT